MERRNRSGRVIPSRDQGLGDTRTSVGILLRDLWAPSQPLALPMPADLSEQLAHLFTPPPKEIPEIRMSRTAYRDILLTVGSRPPETGGILLGPIGSDEMTEFFFDEGGDCSAASYSPDHVTLTQKMKEEWIPSGIDMKGFAHSHPSGIDHLTLGDLAYIARLLEKNDDMDFFVAPILIPSEHRMRPFVVPRETPQTAKEVRLRLF